MNKILLSTVFLFPLSLMAETVPFEEVFCLKTPSKSEFTLNQSYGGYHRSPFGMAAIELGSLEGVIQNSESDAKAQLYYGDTLLAEAGNESGEYGGIINNTITFGAEGLDDDDTPDFTYSWLFMFDASMPQSCRQPGNYKVVIPEGLFIYNEMEVSGATLNYTLKDNQGGGTVVEKFGYTISPEDGAGFKLSSPIDKVTMTVTGNVNFIDMDYGLAPGALYSPEGIKMPFKKSFPTINKNTVTWDFVLKTSPDEEDPITWIPGEYTFIIGANSFGVNQMLDDGEGGNFPEADIKVLYIINDDSVTGVAVEGIEAAPSYTVYTLDGTLVAKSVSSDVLGTLPAGLYIINGTKVVLSEIR
ncbi:MAG: hypothetical protein K2H86_00515 [Muribaculaceae bacterium]|nr:hypothetical protein [Muribaculaceae bacterium]